MLVGSRLDLPRPKLVKTPLALRRFDVRCIRMEFLCGDIFIIAAYRSPSMDNSSCIEFFELINDLIMSLSGRILLVGDLNISCGRPFIHGQLQDCLFSYITEAGLVSTFSGPTRQNCQIDYVFSNFDCSTRVTDGVKSDHRALITSFCCKFDIFFFCFPCSLGIVYLFSTRTKLYFLTLF